LKEVGLVDADASMINKLSHNQSFVRVVICCGLFPGIASVVVSYWFLIISFFLHSKLLTWFTSWAFIGLFI